MRTKIKTPKNTEIDKKSLEEFISGGEREEQETFKFPWKNPKLDKQGVRRTTLKIPEEYALKLDYICKNKIPKTAKQRFILENLISAIDAELKKLP